MSERLRILLVDDNDLTRALLTVILRADEFQIVGEAASADAGLALANQLRPDAILLDVRMPGTPGLDAIQLFKRALPHAAVLMVSAQDDDASVQRALQQGADGYVIKPFNSQTVLGTLRRLRQGFAVSQPAGLTTPH